MHVSRNDSIRFDSIRCESEGKICCHTNCLVHQSWFAFLKYSSANIKSKLFSRLFTVPLPFFIGKQIQNCTKIMITWWKKNDISFASMLCVDVLRKCVSRYLNQLGILISMLEFSFRFLERSILFFVSFVDKLMYISMEIVSTSRRLTWRSDSVWNLSFLEKVGEREKWKTLRSNWNWVCQFCFASSITHVCLNCARCQRRCEPIVCTAEHRYPSHCISVMEFFSLKNEIRKIFVYTCFWRRPSVACSIYNQILF